MWYIDNMKKDLFQWGPHCQQVFMMWSALFYDYTTCHIFFATLPFLSSLLLIKQQWLLLSYWIYPNGAIGAKKRNMQTGSNKNIPLWFLTLYIFFRLASSPFKALTHLIASRILHKVTLADNYIFQKWLYKLGLPLYIFCLTKSKFAI